MTLAGATVAVLEATWLLSARLVPLVFLAFLLIVPRMDGSLAARLVASQRDATLRYGLHLTAGLLAGGVVTLLVPGTIGTAAAAGLVAAAGLYAHRERGVTAAAELGAGWNRRVTLLWLAVPLLAAAALLTQDAVLTRAAALVFYGTIFWVI